MTATAASSARPLTERAVEALRRAGNPFRNYFARNPDDEVCARYHVPELFALERDVLLGIIDLYRCTPQTHSEVVPVLGNKGSGKTHLLHSIKHGPERAWQLLVTPGTTFDVTGTFTVTEPVTYVTLAAAAPTGWTVDGPAVTRPTLAPGQHLTGHWTVHVGQNSADVPVFDEFRVPGRADPVHVEQAVHAFVPPPVPTGAAYVSDLTFVSESNGWGPM